MIVLSGEGYNLLVVILTSMILIPYFLVGAYLVKMSSAQSELWSIKAVGLGASLYGIWLIYAAGIDNLLLSWLLYIPGLMIFYYSRYQARQQTIQNKL